MATISYRSVILICVYYDFMVTYTDRACDSCVCTAQPIQRCYRSEIRIPAFPRPTLLAAGY